jgi:tetratricopeptide (TPR) repeat protein
LTFWRNIRPSAYHQGSGANSLFNRLEWTDWLIGSAEKNPDYSSHLFELFHDQAWTLTLMEDFIKAKKYFRKAWKRRQHHDIHEIELAINIVYFYWKQKKYNKASLWLKLSKELLNKSVDINPETIDRQWLKVWHYEGRIYYERGDQHDLDKADKCFQKAANLAKNINSKRAIYFNHKWVADLYIKANKNLDAAEKLLTECLSMSDENLDKSLIAHCKASLANLKKANQDFVDAKKFAESAYQDFDKLGMLVDKENMELFIQSLEREI